MKKDLFDYVFSIIQSCETLPQLENTMQWLYKIKNQIDYRNYHELLKRLGELIYKEREIFYRKKYEQLEKENEQKKKMKKLLRIKLCIKC